MRFYSIYTHTPNNVCISIYSLRRADHSSKGVLQSVVGPMNVNLKLHKGKATTRKLIQLSQGITHHS